MTFLVHFYKEITPDGFFHVPKDFQYDLLYWLLLLELFLYLRICVSVTWTVFLTQACSGKSMFSPLVNIFLNKTCFFIHITHSSVNFTWFILLSHQKFDDRTLFKPGLLWFFSILDSLKTRFYYKPIPNNCDGKLTKIPTRDFIFARVKTGQVGTWSPIE